MYLLKHIFEQLNVSSSFNTFLHFFCNSFNKFVATEVLGLAFDSLGLATNFLGVATYFLGVAIDLLGVATDSLGVAVDFLGVATDFLGVATESLGGSLLRLQICKVHQHPRFSMNRLFTSYPVFKL